MSPAIKSQIQAKNSRQSGCLEKGKNEGEIITPFKSIEKFSLTSVGVEFHAECEIKDLFS